MIYQLYSISQILLVTISKLVKTCILRITEDKVFFILSERIGDGGAQIWCELSQPCSPMCHPALFANVYPAMFPCIIQPCSPMCHPAMFASLSSSHVPRQFVIQPCLPMCHPAMFASVSSSHVCQCVIQPCLPVCHPAMFASVSSSHVCQCVIQPCLPVCHPALFASVSSSHVPLCVILPCFPVCHPAMFPVCHPAMFASVSSSHVCQCVIQLCLPVCHPALFASVSTSLVSQCVIQPCSPVCHPAMFPCVSSSHVPCVSSSLVSLCVIQPCSPVCHPAMFPVEIDLPTGGSHQRQVVHDIPVLVVPRKHWSDYTEPEMPKFDVSITMPQLKLENVVDKMKNLSNYLSLSANRSGEMKLSVETDMVAVSTHFQNLTHPTWKIVVRAFYRSSNELEKKVFVTARIDIRKFAQFLNSQQVNPKTVVCNIVHHRMVHFFLMHDDLSLQYFLPVISR
ncbi:DNA damage checkpoint control protein [Bulinus truncatus]|nr:DNA damage checkpoint control protein [Bulinus truncatus]